MNGVKLIQTWKKIPNYKYVPVLVLTAESGYDVMRQFLDLHTLDFIFKPFNHQTFFLQPVYEKYLKINKKD